MRPGPTPDAAAAAVAIDARSLDDLLPDAAEVAPAIDAAIPEEVVVDAAAASPDPIEDAGTDVDADLEAEVSADQIVAQLNRLAVQSSGKIDRCYQSATKALPPDQALSGQVDIVFTVLPTGKTGNIQMTRDTIQSPSLLRCLVSIVEDWQFSRHPVEPGINLLRTFTLGPRP